VYEHVETAKCCRVSVRTEKCTTCCGDLLFEYVGPWKGPYGYWVELRLLWASETWGQCWIIQALRPRVLTAAWGLSVLASWRLGVDQWLSCGQSEFGVELWAVCSVRGCAPLCSASDVYSLMVGDQLVPKKLLGTFLCASGSELIAPLLASRCSSSLRLGVKNDADWRRHMWCDRYKCMNTWEQFSQKVYWSFSLILTITEQWLHKTYCTTWDSKVNKEHYTTCRIPFTHTDKMPEDSYAIATLVAKNNINKAHGCAKCN
jgi:hypothetical protein